jgi:hypothetical protein
MNWKRVEGSYRGLFQKGVPEFEENKEDHKNLRKAAQCVENRTLGVMNT